VPYRRYTDLQFDRMKLPCGRYRQAINKKGKKKKMWIRACKKNALVHASLEFLFPGSSFFFDLSFFFCFLSFTYSLESAPSRSFSNILEHFISLIGSILDVACSFGCILLYLIGFCFTTAIQSFMCRERRLNSGFCFSWLDYKFITTGVLLFFIKKQAS
jgi:hypothetical protein